MDFNKYDTLNLIRILKSEFLLLYQKNKIVSRLNYNHYKVLDKFINILKTYDMKDKFLDISLTNNQIYNLGKLIKVIGEIVLDEISSIYPKLIDYKVSFNITTNQNMILFGNTTYEPKKIIFLLNYTKHYIELVAYRFDKYDITNIPTMSILSFYNINPNTIKLKHIPYKDLINYLDEHLIYELI